VKYLLSLTDSLVLKCLQAFQKALALEPQNFVHSIYWMQSVEPLLLLLGTVLHHLLSGKAPSCLAPWLCGAPLTALLKKEGGIFPIAVSEVLQCIASQLCCLAVRPSLPGALGVGIPGGLEAAIHATHHYISQNNSDSTFALLKIDMKNSAVCQLSSPVLTMSSQQFLLGLSGVILNLLSYILAQDISMLPLGCSKVIL